MASGVAQQQRYTRQRPCPICGGGDDMPRGKGRRCSGYLSAGERYAYCTREEHAGRLELQQTDPPSFRHLLEGECWCGVEHRPAAGSNGRGEIVATYDYQDAHGELVYQVVRFSPKRFLQRRPDGHGDWVWNLHGVARLPYRLPQVLSSISFSGGGEPIYVCEGEKDVHALELLHVTATCNSGGAGKWDDSHSAYLRGAAEIVVVAHRDDQGLRHAADVETSLQRVLGDDCPTIRTVTAKTGNDAHEHIAAGHTLAELEPTSPGAPEIEPFEGLTHADVLELKFEGDRQLVEDLIECGVVGTIAGVPETHKTWLAQAIAIGIAQGEGEILGCKIVGQGPVGYFWQDDSRRNEAERIQLYASIHQTPPDIPLRWFLNEGLELDRDLDKLRATIEHHHFVLVTLDSFYNIAEGIDLKDSGAGQIIAALKNRITDPTGCTILIVDHMPWATDTNRSRLRAYGDVFKGAAIRQGIYIDAEGTKLYIEARGNNIRGFKRTPAYWDQDALQLRLLTAPEPLDEDELQERVIAYVTQNPGTSMKQIEDALEGSRKSLRLAAERGAISGHIARGPGRHPRGKYWYPANQAGFNSPGDMQATLGDMSPELLGERESAPEPAYSPCKGEGEWGDSPERHNIDADIPF